jgi:DNA-binding NtrC family response regulator
LEHIVERSVLRAGGRAITADLILIDESPIGSAPKENELESLLHLPFRDSVRAWERLLIDRALKAANGNKAEAARALGIHRRLLYEKLGSEDPSSET